MPFFTGLWRRVGKSRRQRPMRHAQKRDAEMPTAPHPFRPAVLGTSRNHPPAGAIYDAPFDVTGLPSALRTRAGRKAPPSALVALCRASSERQLLLNLGKNDAA